MNEIIVLFEVTIKNEKIKDYLAMAESLKGELSKIEGFIHAERFSSLAIPNKLLSMTIWKDEASVERWRNQLAHRAYQKLGRNELFIDYKISVVAPLRTYTMSNRQNAPKDSNSFLRSDNAIYNNI